MSSKLVRPGDPVEVASIAWRQLGAGFETARRRPADDPVEPEAAGIENQAEARVQAAYRQGRAEGEEAAAERLAPALVSLKGVLQELASLRKRFRAAAEEDTVKLAIAIARRVLHRELATDPDAILGLVMAAFQKLNARETYRLRVSPPDAAVLEQNRARLELPQGLELCPDASLGSGSVFFETARGELDASIDTQLMEIQRGFADLIGRRAK